MLITKGTDTEEVAHRYFGDVLPQWLRLIDQEKDINLLLDSVDCFISSSDHETFSYAVAEAVVTGIPVIQSDINGTQWNASSPATMTFPMGNAFALSQCMKTMIETSQSDIKQRVKAAREQAIEVLSLNRWASRVTDFFKRI